MHLKFNTLWMVKLYYCPNMVNCASNINICKVTCIHCYKFQQTSKKEPVWCSFIEQPALHAKQGGDRNIVCLHVTPTLLSSNTDSLVHSVCNNFFYNYNFCNDMKQKWMSVSASQTQPKIMTIKKKKSLLIQMIRKSTCLNFRAISLYLQQSCTSSLHYFAYRSKLLYHCNHQVANKSSPVQRNAIHRTTKK